MKRLLITAIGGDIAQGAASILRQEFADWQLFGVDIQDRHAGTRFVDRFEIGVQASDPSYLAWLTRFVAENEIDYCLPMSEIELSAFARAGMDRIGRAPLLWAGARAVEIGCDKLATAEFIRSIGVPTPWTQAATSDVVPAAFPCIFKLRRSAGSKAVFVCETLDDVRFLQRRYPAAVLQEQLPGEDREVTCAVYRTRAGDVHVLQLLRRLGGGFTTWGRVIDEAEIYGQCRSIAEALDLRGPINIQLRITPGGPRIFEINPRLSSTALMRHLVGYTDVKWMVQEAEGGGVTYHAPAPGTTLARTQGATLLLG